MICCMNNHSCDIIFVTSFYLNSFSGFLLVEFRKACENRDHEYFNQLYSDRVKSMLTLVGAKMTDVLLFVFTHRLTAVFF